MNPTRWSCPWPWVWWAHHTHEEKERKERMKERDRKRERERVEVGVLAKVLDRSTRHRLSLLFPLSPSLPSLLSLLSWTRATPFDIVFARKVLLKGKTHYGWPPRITCLDQILLILKMLLTLFAEQDFLIRRSIVLNLPRQLAFPVFTTACTQHFFNSIALFRCLSE